MSKAARVSMIFAMGKNRVIGSGNRLPWHLPADLAFFKRTTMGRTVVMGRKTYESIGRPLPGRTNVILTRDPDYAAAGCKTVHSVQEALAQATGDELFVIGGEEVYRLFLPYADRLYVTVIEHEFEGDAFFPEIDESAWKIVSRTEGTIDEKNRYPHTFITYERITGRG